MQTLLTLSIALFAGLMLSRLAKLVKLPAVTAYLIAGILVGPYVLGALGSYLSQNFGIQGIGLLVIMIAVVGVIGTKKRKVR